MRTLMVGRAGGALAAAGVAAFLLGHGCAEAGATPTDKGHAASSDSPAGHHRDTTQGGHRQKADRRSRDDDPEKRQNRARAGAQRPVSGDASAPGTASDTPRRRPVTSPSVTDTTAPASLRTVALRALAPADGSARRSSAPQTPADTPAEWTLLAAARRNFDRIAPRETAPQASVAAAQPDESRSAATEITVTPANPADLRTLYTGRTTIFTKAVTLGLEALGTVLRPLGGIVNFTTLKVPVVADGIPPAFVTKGLNVERSDFEGMTVWTLQPPDPSAKYVVALHGGAYAAEASIFHYIMYAALARNTGATVVVPDYPLVAEGGTAAQVVPVSADFIAQVIADHGADNVSVLGDSAGGGLAVAAVRTLVARGSETPGRMVLLAPWLDVTMSDPLSARIADPLLTIRSLRKFGSEWAGSLDPADPSVSPLFGSLNGLPPTTVFSGSLDMLAPDTLRLRDRATAEGLTNFSFVLRKGLIHDWPIFSFLPEAYSVRSQMYSALLGTTAAVTKSL